MCERDALRRADPQHAAPSEPVERARDEREPHRVKVAQDLGHIAWHAAGRERLQRRRLRPVRALVQGDQLVEDPFGRVTARLPSLDAANDRIGMTTKCYLDKTLLGGRV